MATDPNNIPIPSREQFGLSPIDEVRRDQVTPTLAAPTPTLTIAAPGVIPTGQLDWIMSTIARLESRLSANDRRMSDHRAPPRPDPDPPYALPLSAAVRDSQLPQQPLHTAVRDSQLPQQPFHTAVLDHQFPHQPFTTATHNTIPHYPDITAHNHPSLTGFPSLQHAPSYHPPPWTTSNHFGHYRDYNANFPVGPRPTSCWYPSVDRPPRNHHSHAEFRPLQQKYQPLRPMPPPPPQSHRCSAAPLLAAAPPPPPAPMIPPCSSDRIHTLSTMPQCVAAAVPPPPASISLPCRVTSSALDDEIETTNLVEVNPGLRVNASQLKPEITQPEQMIPQGMGMIEHLDRKTLMSSQEFGMVNAQPMVTVVDYIDDTNMGQVQKHFADSRITVNTTMRLQKQVLGSDVEVNHQDQSFATYCLAMEEKGARENYNLREWDRDKSTKVVTTTNFAFMGPRFMLLMPFGSSWFPPWGQGGFQPWGS